MDAQSPAPKAIITPSFDTLCVGGLSIVLMVPILIYGDLGRDWKMLATVLALGINMPHFIVSYRLLYNTRENILRYPWASIYVPAGLIIYALFALVMSTKTPLYVSLMTVVSSGYLAWHYTGQAWGMMASFAYLSGLRFEKSERRLLRLSLYIMLAWHVAWFGDQLTLATPDLPSWLVGLLRGFHVAMNWISIVALFMGLLGRV